MLSPVCETDDIFLLGGSHGLLETEKIHVLSFSIQATAKSKYTFGKKSGGYIFWLTRQQKQFLVSGNMNSHNDISIKTDVMLQ